MSRRNQSSRRRSYGRRQHEVRERHTEDRQGSAFPGDGEFELDTDQAVAEAGDERVSYESFGGFSR
jgi:hypothetical protein